MPSWGLNMGPQLYLILALIAAAPATYGYMWIKQQIVVAKAFEQGKEAGAGSVAAKTTEKSASTVAAVAEGENEAPVISPEKAKLIQLCNRSASCRDRTK